MTKEYFLDLAKYNQWANEKFIHWAKPINAAQWDKELVSSFPSIAQTVIHIIGAEMIWHDRLLNIPNPVWLPLNFKGDKNTTLDVWRKSSELLINFIENINSEHILFKQSYKRINGEAFTQPVYEILSHVFNHSTYHRGQLVTLFRQVGFTDVTSTDLLLYYRK